MAWQPRREAPEEKKLTLWVGEEFPFRPKKKNPTASHGVTSTQRGDGGLEEGVSPCNIKIHAQSCPFPPQAHTDTYIHKVTIPGNQRHTSSEQNQKKTEMRAILEQTRCIYCSCICFCFFTSFEFHFKTR